MTEYAFEGPKRSSATISWSFAAQTFSYDASTPFSGFVAAAYQSTVQAAFARWASVSGLTFTQVADGASVPIRVGFEAFAQAGELGETDYHSARGAFSNDTVVRLLDPAASPLTLGADGQFYYQAYNVTLMQVTLHEIGHALGLDHTTDAATVMYPYAWSYNRDLAAGDIQGINTLYPYYTVASATPVQDPSGQTDSYTFVITRYSDPAVALTINYAIKGAPYPTLSGSVAADASAFVGGVFPAGQVSFAAGSATATLTIPVLGTPPAQPDEGFAITLASLNARDSVTVRGEVNALIVDASGLGQVSGASIGVYRFFDRTTGEHFYSADQGERNNLILTQPTLAYEGVGLRAVASPSSDAAAVPVFRFFDLTNGTHFYSINPAERDNIVATRSDLAFEGTAFYEHGTAQTGDTPVYRFFDTDDGSHFFTASASERAAILATRPDLRDEGIGFYAPSV